jgi:hypothetical protein
MAPLKIMTMPLRGGGGGGGGRGGGGGGEEGGKGTRKKAPGHS